MSYRIEQKDIVIEGFQDGIADSPHLGIGDMRNINIISYPKEGSVNFGTTAFNVPPVITAVAFSATNVGDLFTWVGTPTLYNGVAINFPSLSSGGAGVSTGVVYYVGNISGSTFQVFTNISQVGGAVNITSDITGTFTTYVLLLSDGAYPAQKSWQTTDVINGRTYIIDYNNKVWYLYVSGITGLTTNSLIFTGNITSTADTNGNGVVFWKGRLLVFRSGFVDYSVTGILTTAPASVWTYTWQTTTITRKSYQAIAAQDDGIYFCNGSAVGSILEVAGSTFNPANAATYTYNATALAIPTDDQATCLAELGVNLLVGGVKSFIYPWNRIATSYNYPLVVAESYTYRITSTNANAYIFSGSRGRIYITNGSNVQVFKKVPDSISGTVNPYFRWYDAYYSRNQLYFTLKAFSNANSGLSTASGLWAVDLDTEAFRLENQQSYATYAGSGLFIAPNITSSNPAGNGLFIGWNSTSSGTTDSGVDISSTVPYSNFEAYIDTDIIPVGTFLKPFTPSQVEWKTSVPIGVNGTSESIRIAYRVNLSDSFSTINTTTSTTGQLSDVFQANFENAQWVQLRIYSSSNSTTPTYCRMTELRIRDYIAKT